MSYSHRGAVYRDNQSRARLAELFLLVASLVYAVQAGYYAWLLGRLGHVVATSGVLAFETALRVTLLVVLVTSAVLFLRWFRRAVENAVANGLRLQRSFDWSIGCWLIPFVNLVAPFQLASSMWRQAGVERTGRTPWHGLWWTCWAIGNVGAGVSGQMLSGARGRDQVAYGLKANLAVDSLLVVAGVFALVVVRRLTRAQSEMRLLVRAEAAFGDETSARDLARQRVVAAVEIADPPVAADAVPVSTTPGERPVVGSTCGGCGRRIEDDLEAAVCTDCDQPLHEACLRGGTCPRCRGRELDRGFRLY